MPSAKIVVTIADKLLRQVDRWVASGEYPNRSRVVHEGLVSLREKRARGRRLLGELSSLDPEEERGLAEEASRHEVHRTAR